jgi:hypothetical protein
MLPRLSGTICTSRRAWRHRRRATYLLFTAGSRFGRQLAEGGTGLRFVGVRCRRHRLL